MHDTFLLVLLGNMTMIVSIHDSILCPSMWVSFNIIRSRLNGRHFADDILKLLFFVREWRNFYSNFSECVPRGSINNRPTLVQIMACRRMDDKSLSVSMLVWIPDAYIRYLASMS